MESNHEFIPISELTPPEKIKIINTGRDIQKELIKLEKK